MLRDSMESTVVRRDNNLILPQKTDLNPRPHRNPHVVARVHGAKGGDKAGEQVHPAQAAGRGTSFLLVQSGQLLSHML